MIGIISESNSPAYNLAMEEYLLKNSTEDIFLLYSDSPSIICGKHQNMLAEINYMATKSMHIPVYRRLSGGGTVYHDEGNLNFCFITNGKGQNLIDFKGFTKPIVEALQSIGANAYYGGRNDLLIGGNKISGNACHVYKNRVMHHGTLLYNSNLSNLGNALKTDPTKYTDRAVKSVRSVVTNIQDHLPHPLSFDQFKNTIFNHVVNTNKYSTLNDDALQTIEALVNTKYSTWQWNFGYSPEYTFKRRFALHNTNIQIQVEFTVHKGFIQTIKTLANKETEKFSAAFSNLVNTPHEPTSMNIILKNHLPLPAEITIDQIIENLF
jgi:lipoate---protein ligase